MERLAKTKAKYEQALQNKNRNHGNRVHQKHMEDQMCKEREAVTKANEHQLQTIMSELCTLKENQVKDTTDRKAGEKALLDQS